MRILKRLGIALLVFVIVLLLASAITLWLIFTPEKLTRLAIKEANINLSCNTNLEKVEASFFRTYPFFGIELTNCCLTEKNNSPNIDTLFYASKCFASLNLKSYLFEGDIIIRPILVADAYLNFKIDSLGQSNFDIVTSSPDSTAGEPEESRLGDINISKVEITNFNARYTNEETLETVYIKNVYAMLECSYSKEKQHFDVDMQLNSLLYLTSDSMALTVDAKNCDLNISSTANDKNRFNSDFRFACKEMDVAMAGEEFFSKIKIDTHVPCVLSISENSLGLNEAKLIINDEYEVSVGGTIKILDENSISTDMIYSTKSSDIEKIMPLIPKTYTDLIEDINAKGYAQLSGTIKGILSDTITPVVTANIIYQKGEIKYIDYPTVNDIQLSMSTVVDMNKNQDSYITINNSSGIIENSTVSVTGNISKILEEPIYDIHAHGKLVLSDFESFIPSNQNIIVQGTVDGNLHLQFSQSDLNSEEYHRFRLTGSFNTQNINAIYNDTITMQLPLAMVNLNLPGLSGGDKNLLFAKIKIDAPKLNINMSSAMGAVTQNLELSADINNLAKGTYAPISSFVFKLDNLYATYDTLALSANNMDGQFKYVPTFQSNGEIADINSTINSNKIVVAGKDSILFDAKKLYAETNFCYDDSQNDLMRKWQPDLALSFSDAVYNLSKQLNGKMPSVSFQINPDTMEIKKADFILGNSDFSLSGQLTDISKYINNQALLKGNFNLVSKNTDVYELMDIFNGMGSQDSSSTKKEQPASENDPFIVPKGLEIRLNTKIDQTVVNDHIIENIKGGLTVKDGTLILDQMGFTNKAANMQLTAMYRSDRKNHLFTGIDFHLLNIDIAELIELIPSVDTILPMLKSFEGKGEFHLGGEAYLTSDYSPKQSTIRGAAAFQGQELTLMDNETFDMIAHKLLFNKKTENVIDSLSVEMTLFKDEIDLFPFLIVMDNYKAVISGRHTMDNHLNYHISVTDSPLPVRLGLNVSGTIDELKYELVPCKYKHLYNPEKQGALESQTLRLKNLISESLKENVKEIK